MLILHFGPITPTNRGSVGACALHIQCPWRVDNADATITGRDDLWEYAGPGERPAAWLYEDGLSLQDQKLNAVFGPYDQSRGGGHFPDSTKFEVVEATQSEHGDIQIHFSGGYSIKVFPAGRAEAWRLFRPDGEEHLVFPDGI